MRGDINSSPAISCCRLVSNDGEAPLVFEDSEEVPADEDIIQLLVIQLLANVSFRLQLLKGFRGGDVRAEN